MLKNSILVKEFSYEDDKSVDFSVDPNMYEKLGIKKAKKGEESAFDVDKLYEFQLKKDIQKIRAVKGTYKSRNNLYLGIRQNDPYYQAVASAPQSGKDGNFADLLHRTTDHSWRSTSQPYGIIAHKRYLEYLRNLPKGPSEDEIRDRLQRKTDNDLWEQIQTGKLEPTRKELRQKERLAAERELRAHVEENLIDLHKDERERARKYRELDFEGLRRLPTLRQYNSSIDRWHRGIHYPCDLSGGFPVVTRDISGSRAGAEVMEDRRTFESFTSAPTYSSVQFTGKERKADAQYLAHLSQQSFAKAERFLKEHRAAMELAEKRAAEERMAAEKARRRVGATTSLIKDVLTQVKVATYQREHAFTMKADEIGAVADENHCDSSDSDSSSDADDPLTGTPGAKADAITTIAVGENTKGSTTAATGRPASAAPTRAARPVSAVGARNKDTAVQNHSTSGRFERLSAAVWRPSRILFRTPSSATIVPSSRSDDDPAPGQETATRATAKRSTSSKGVLSGVRSLYLSAAERLEDSVFFRSAEDAHEQRKQAERHSQRKDGSNLRRQLNELELQLLASTRPQSYMHNSGMVSESRAVLIPRDEFDKEIKARKRRLRLQIQKLQEANKVMTAEDSRVYSKLKVRLEALRATAADRDALDRIETDKAAKIRAFIDETRNRLEAEARAKKSTRYYRWTHLLSEYRKRKRREKIQAAEREKERLSAAHTLPPFDAAENQRVMNVMIELRAKEKEAENYFGRLLERWTGIPPKEPVVRCSVEDLILAAQSGRYRDVLDMVLHPTHPVGPNAVSTDGTTATYCTLLMILRSEVLQDDRNLDMLLLSPWQRWRKRHAIFRGKKTSAVAQLESVLQILLHQGGDVLFATKEGGRDGYTIMHNAAEEGGLEMVRWLLALGVSPNIRTTKLRKTPLMLAAENDRLEMAMLLLKSGAMATINEPDINGWTALHHVTATARPELAKVLLICGAATNIRNAQGRLPQEEATQRGRAEMAAAILSFRSDVVDHLSRIDHLVGAQPGGIIEEEDEENGEEKELI